MIVEEYATMVEEIDGDHVRIKIHGRKVVAGALWTTSTKDRADTPAVLLTAQPAARVQ